MMVAPNKNFIAHFTKVIVNLTYNESANKK